MNVQGRYGVEGTETEGVFFTEKHLSLGTPLGRDEVRLNRQNKNLRDVKVRMADEAQQRGGDVIANFRYGQRAHKWYQRFRWDEEAWYGEGDLVRVD